MTTVRRLALSAVGVSLPFVALADHPVGSVVENGAVLEINEEGLTVMTDMVGSLIPPTIDVPPFHYADPEVCGPLCFEQLIIDLQGMWIALTMDTLEIVPGTDSLTMHAEMTLTVNSASDPADMYIYVLEGIPWFDDWCDLWIDPVHLTVDAPMTLNLVPDPAGVDVDGDGTIDTKRLDVVIPEPLWGWDADDQDFNFGDCLLATTVDLINEITSLFGLNLYDMVLDLLEPIVDQVVASLPGIVEPLLEDTFASLTLSEVIDLGVPMTLTVWPDSIAVTPRVGPTPGAIRVGMSTAVDVPTAECVQDYVGSGSSATPSSPPPIGDTGGVAFSPMMNAYIDDDLVNYVLYSAWAGGLLCYDLTSDDPTLTLPLPIDTSLLGIVAPGVFDAYFPETEPMSILLDPKAPPVEDLDGPHDIDIVANDLGLGFVAQLDGRKTRLFQVDADAVAGVDLNFDPLTGNLQFLLAVTGDDFVATTTYGELVPEANEQIAGQFSTLFDLLIAPIITDLGNDLVFPPSNIEGLGLLELDAAQTGPSGDWLGAYTRVGPVPYYSYACDTSKKGGYKCDTSSCDKGCSSSGGPIALFGFPLIVAALRRRRKV